MSRNAIFSLFLASLVFLSNGGKAFAYSCGPHSFIKYVSYPKLTHCGCVAGYVAITHAVTNHVNPGCGRAPQPVAKKKLIPVDPDNRFGNAPIHRELQAVTHDSPHFNPGALSIDKKRKIKRGLKPIDMNERIQ